MQCKTCGFGWSKDCDVHYENFPCGCGAWHWHNRELVKGKLINVT